jgi:hypothetical protein
MGLAPSQYPPQYRYSIYSQDDFAWYEDTQGNIVSWIDNTGTGQGNLASGGGGGPQFADAETPSGVINGTNTVFNLQFIPNPVASLQFTKNGQILLNTIDYTILNNVVTLMIAPQPPSGDQPLGDILAAWYRY